MDVTNLYTMIPQEGGVTAIKRLIEATGLKQIRDEAMGSPLTLTIANAYMYFVERPISKWATRTCSLYYRYIDDLFIMSNVHADILKALVCFWNRLDSNIEFSETTGQSIEHLDIKLENRGGKLVLEVFHQPSYEPYFLPYNSIHVKHIKKNIPFGALVRAITYSSDYNAFKREETHICMSLLLNRYPMDFVLKQLERVPRTFRCAVPTRKNYSDIRKIFLNTADDNVKKAEIDFKVNILCHFSFCKGMNDFSTRFHKLWDDCFSDTAICNMKPIVGSKRLDNLHDYLVKKKPDKSLLKITYLNND
jgi:hypothetical protein